MDTNGDSYSDNINTISTISESNNSNSTATIPTLPPSPQPVTSCDVEPHMFGPSMLLVMTSSVRLPDEDVPVDLFRTDMCQINDAINVDRFKVHLNVTFDRGVAGTASVRRGMGG